jgi:hypothetical protein
MRLLHCLLAGGLLLATHQSLAAHERPSVRLLRHEENWSALCDPARKLDLIDHLKCIPLLGSAVSHLSIGGEIRQRYEFTRNPAFGASPQDRWGAWQQRYVLHGDLVLGPQFRLFGQLLAGAETGLSGPPGTFDTNRTDVQQAFAEFRLPLGSLNLQFRAGRQELRYGSARLIDIREGPNVRRKFDGAVASLSVGSWRIDALAVRPARLSIGSFDDDTDTRVQLGGLYATGTAQAWLPLASSLDVYMLGFRNQRARFDRLSGDETRYSAGTRLFGTRGPLDWNWEATLQGGDIAGRRIRAWALYTDTGYTFREMAWEPRLGLSVNAASGDRDPADRTLGTFNAMFPRASFFSDIAILGPRNFWNLMPSVSLRPHRDISVDARLNLFWRMEARDGVYRPSGALLRSGAGSAERFVGTELSISTTWRASERLRFMANYGRFFPGAFLKATGPSRPIDLVELTAQYRF